MTRSTIRHRLGAVLVVLFLVLGALPATGAAQEDDSTAAEPQTTEQAPPAEEPAPPPAEEPAPPPAEEPANPSEPVFEAPVEEPVVEPSPSPSPAPSEPPVDVPASPEPESPPTDPSAPVTDPDPSTPDGTEAPTDDAAEGDATEDAEVVAADEPALVSVTVLAVNCDTAPATVVGGVIPDGCVKDAGLKFEASVGSISLGTYTTNGNGVSRVSAYTGETLAIAEILSSVSSGFTAETPNTSIAVADGAAVTLVHVLTDAEPVPPTAVGRVQLSQGSCPSGDPDRTELRYLPPASVQASAQDGSGCQGVAGAEFQVTKLATPESVSAAAVEGVKRTDANGNWRGELPAGSYTVTHVASGESIAIEVVADELSTVVAINYVQAIEGTLSIRRYACPGSSDSTAVTVASSEPSPRAGCQPEDGTFQLNSGEPFTSVNNFGAVTFELPIGTYSFSDLTGGDGAAAQIQVASNATTWVMVERLMTPGELTVRYNACTAPVSASQDATNASFWTSACNNPIGGAEVQLVAASGTVVGGATTDADGYATFFDVVSGTYQVRAVGQPGTCATFVGSSAAPGDISVTNGQFVQGQAFGCTRAASGGGGGGTPGGGNPIPGLPGGTPGGNPVPSNPGGGVVQLPAPSSNTSAPMTVSQLPSTGTANALLQNPHLTLWALLAAVAMAAMACLFAIRYSRQG